jgi:hypothetical protein
MLAILIGPIIELPALLGLTRIMLHLRHAITWPADQIANATGLAAPKDVLGAEHR